MTVIKAFPHPGAENMSIAPHTGMNLLDWFAGQALAGIMASNFKTDAASNALVAYHHAEAMMRERVRRNA